MGLQGEEEVAVLWHRAGPLLWNLGAQEGEENASRTARRGGGGSPLAPIVSPWVAPGCTAQGFPAQGATGECGSQREFLRGPRQCRGQHGVEELAVLRHRWISWG